LAHSPESMEDMVKRLESGADLVVVEQVEQRGQASRALRLARHWAPRLLRIPGLRDTMSGFVALRLIVLRQALRSDGTRLLLTDGWCASAELLARLTRHARRVDTVPAAVRPSPHSGAVCRGRAAGVRGAVRAVQRRDGHHGGRGCRYDPRGGGGAFPVPDRRWRAVVPHSSEPRVVGGAPRLPIAPLPESDRRE